MGADYFLVFYGLRVDLGNYEDQSIDYNAINLLELQTHPLQTKAQSAGLETWWENFSLRSEHYLLFIGKKIGTLGWEYLSSLSLSETEINAITVDVKSKLRQAGLSDAAKLWLQFGPDH